MEEQLGTLIIAVVCFGLFFTVLNQLAKLLHWYYRKTGQEDKIPKVKTKKPLLKNLLSKIGNEKKVFKKKEYNYQKYVDYLKSPAWKWKKRQRYDMDFGHCQQCLIELSPARAQCHHIHYKNIYKEDVKEDLVTVCKECHKTIHEYHGKNAIFYPLLDLEKLSKIKYKIRNKEDELYKERNNEFSGAGL